MKKPKILKSDDLDLLDQLLDCMNQLILWEICFDLLGVTKKKKAEILETRFKAIRHSGSIPGFYRQHKHEFNKKFFLKLAEMLISFADRKNLGKEYDRRRAREFGESMLAFVEKQPDKEADLERKPESY